MAAHDLRDDAVGPERREPQRHRREGKGQERAQAAQGQGLPGQLVEGHQVGDGLLGVLGPHRRAQGGSERSRVARGAHREADERDRLLRVRDVHRRVGLVVVPEVPHVADDPDDLAQGRRLALG